MDAFVYEANIMRNLAAHPNVIQFLGVTVDPTLNSLCIITQFCSGGSLYDGISFFIFLYLFWIIYLLFFISINYYY